MRFGRAGTDLVDGPGTGWLVRDDQVLASVEVAVGRMAKARGLLGRDHLEGALVIPGRRSVHSFSMGFELDVAFLDGNGTVIRTLRLRKRRVTLPVWQARCVVEAEAGAFGEWELKVGDELEIRLVHRVDDEPGDDEPGHDESGVIEPNGNEPTGNEPNRNEPNGDARNPNGPAADDVDDVPSSLDVDPDVG